MNFETLNEKKKEELYKKTVIRVCVKKMSKNIFYWVKKKTCLGCFRIEEIRDKNNEIGFKEGGGIEMSNYSAPFTITIITI